MSFVYWAAGEAPSIRPISATRLLRAIASSFSIGRLVNNESGSQGNGAPGRRHDRVPRHYLPRCMGPLCPVRRHRMSGPDWAGLASGIIANRENEIHHGSIWRGKFLPTLRAKA